MFFRMGSWSALVERKKECFLARNSFICSILKRAAENLWSICYKHRADRDRATLSGLIYHCFVIADPMSCSIAQFSSIFAVASQIITLKYMI